MRHRTRHCKKEPGKRPLRRKTGRPSGRTGIQHCRHAEGKDPHGNHFPDHPLLSGPDPETGEIAWIALGWKTPRRFPPQWKGRRKIRRPFGSSLVVHRFGCQMLTHLPLNMKPGGRDGLPFGKPLPRWNQRTNGNSQKRSYRRFRSCDRCIQLPTPTP